MLFYFNIDLKFLNQITLTHNFAKKLINIVDNVVFSKIISIRFNSCIQNRTVQS